jgi:hypothetical protein
MRTNHNRAPGILRTVAILVCIPALVFGMATESSVNEQLLQAAQNSSPEQIKALLTKGADVNATNEEGLTALDLASTLNQPEIVQYLKAHGAMLSISSVSSSPVAEDESEAAEEESGVSSSGKTQTSFCKEVSKMIKDGTIDNDQHTPEYQSPSPDPRGAEYLNLDIDGDGIADKVEVSSGSEGESLLVVQLSSGDVYELHEGGFIKIVKIKKQIYAVVTYWEWHRQPDGSREGKQVGNRLYKLTKQEPELVCDKENLKKR